jgi:hypothetical protein
VGDISYPPEFLDIAKRFADQEPGHGFELILIPIGLYAPRKFMKNQHVDPMEGVENHKDLSEERSVA